MSSLSVKISVGKYLSNSNSTVDFVFQSVNSESKESKEMVCVVEPEKEKPPPQEKNVEKCKHLVY